MSFFLFACFSFLVLNFRLLGCVGLGSRLFCRFVRSLSPPLSHPCFLWVFSFYRLRIEGRPAEEPEYGQTGGRLGSPAAVVAGVLPVGYLPPPGKGKGKISEIRYLDGSEYLRVTVRYADVVGPSRVEPSYAKTFAIRYGPLSSV